MYALSLLSLLPLVAAAPAFVDPRQTTSSCASGVHIIAARGSTEPQGEGPLQALSTLIEAGVPGSTDSAVIYPATILTFTSTYFGSEESGVTNMTLMIQQYVASCPDARLVLTGYSQGAQIIGDVLGGGSFKDTAPLAESYRKNSMSYSLVQFPRAK
jgi:acetylxylan esterase